MLRYLELDWSASYNILNISEQLKSKDCFASKNEGASSNGRLLCLSLVMHCQECRVLGAYMSAFGALCLISVIIQLF